MAEVLEDHESSQVTVRADQDVVASAVPTLRSQLREAMENSPRELVLDLEKVEMMDSSGIGLLIAAHNSLRRQGGRLAVVHASHDILELLRAMRLHQHFTVSGE